MAKKGLQRIGVIISLAWVLFIIGWATLEVSGFGVPFQFVYEYRVDLSSQSVEPGGLLTDEEIFGGYRIERRLAFEAVMFSILVPIIILWIGGYIIAYAAKWVYVGFKGEISKDVVAQDPIHNASEMTWSKFWMWTALLYIATVIGLLFKLNEQYNGLPIDSIWQLSALLLLSALFMLLFGVVVVIYLAIKKFNISTTRTFMISMAITYMVALLFWLIAGPPL